MVMFTTLYFSLAPLYLSYMWNNFNDDEKNYLCETLVHVCMFKEAHNPMSHNSNDCQ